MGNCRFIWDNRFFDAATLTPSSEVATLPAVNLQDHLKKRVWRTTGKTSETLQIDFGFASNPGMRPVINALALVNHNLSETGTITVLDPDGNSETFAAWAPVIGYGEGGYGMLGYGGYIPEEDRPFYTPFPNRVVYLATPGRAQGVWTITFADPMNPAGYLQIGRLFPTYYMDLRYSHAMPWDMGGEDDSEIVRSPDGQPWTKKRGFRTALAFSWEALADVDKYWSVWLMVKKMGLHTDWIIDPQFDGVSRRYFTALYGRFASIPDLSQVMSGISELEIDFIETP